MSIFKRLCVYSRVNSKVRRVYSRVQRVHSRYIQEYEGYMQAIKKQYTQAIKKTTSGKVEQKKV